MDPMASDDDGPAEIASVAWEGFDTLHMSLSIDRGGPFICPLVSIERAVSLHISARRLSIICRELRIREDRLE
jgi:hypothetical protein